MAVFVVREVKTVVRRPDGRGTRAAAEMLDRVLRPPLECQLPSAATFTAVP
jgi:hypothetical protein